jgi:hypothetical protein
VPQGPPPQGYMPPGSGPRLNVPQRPGLNASYAPPEPAPYNPAAPGMRQPPRVTRETDDYDNMGPDDGLFDDPAPSLNRAAGRRPTTNDYQQAYRDAEAGYEDEQPRSRLPWILAGMLVVGSLIAGLLVWGYLTLGKPAMNGTQQSNTTTNEVPAVPAPAQPAKAQPDQAQQGTAASGATRKQIYDRIVGDQEVLGGQITPTEEVPQTGGASAVPQPANGASGQAPADSGDAVPLPIPPPPGDNTQGALPNAQP